MTLSATTTTCALEEALKYAQMGLRVFPLQPSTKIPMTAHGVKDATDDPALIKEWWTRTPEAGIGLAARAKKVGDPCFLEFDQRPWMSEWAKELNHPKPQTRLHKSGGKESPHYIFKHTEKSLALGNCDGAKDGHEWFSFRAANRYIVAPPSVHPDSRKPYTVELDVEPVPIPDWHFETAHWQDDWSPRYNIAPTQPVPVIRQHPKEPVRQISTMRWGLIPHWAKDTSGAAKMINARSETAATKPAFRDALKSRRCLIPADGFYEWKRTEKSKQPYCFEVNSGELFGFAGLWDGWKDASGNWIKSCSILTTTPNAVTSAVHDRMPVILDRDSCDLWLDPGMQDGAAISELLKPCDARLMRSYPVSTRINHVVNDDEECSRRVEMAQNRLFS